MEKDNGSDKGHWESWEELEKQYYNNGLCRVRVNNNSTSFALRVNVGQYVGLSARCSTFNALNVHRNTQPSANN